MQQGCRYTNWAGFRTSSLSGRHLVQQTQQRPGADQVLS